MKCPTCDGEKTVVGIGCPGFKRVEIPCFTCNGSGDCAEAQIEAIRKGKLMRDQRIKADRSLREQADILGIKASTLSDLERGKIL